eukprot:TRINITY_DN5866_c0_g1_i6.p2 TRINITY_DN5866_c0_g1~~TRINITY_DN5866_c0_g1_i6.p2  ORF type:complete len:124 (+),score=13.96 TRINITY_DN5866_c0_g1_i6:931-1302(+)
MEQVLGCHQLQFGKLVNLSKGQMSGMEQVTCMPSTPIREIGESFQRSNPGNGAGTWMPSTPIWEIESFQRSNLGNGAGNLYAINSMQVFNFRPTLLNHQHFFISSPNKTGLGSFRVLIRQWYR